MGGLGPLILGEKIAEERTASRASNPPPPHLPLPQGLDQPQHRSSRVFRELSSVSIDSQS